MEIVRGAGLRMVGPSSLGVRNTSAEVNLDATFTGARVREGALAIGYRQARLDRDARSPAARQLGVLDVRFTRPPLRRSTNDLLKFCSRTSAPSRRAVRGVVRQSGEARGSPGRARIKPVLAARAPRAERPLSEARRTRRGAARDAVIDGVLHQAGVRRFHSGEQLFDAVSSSSASRCRTVGESGS